MKTKPVCWSKFPRDDYSVMFEGKLYGIGINPLFEMVPGAWNLLVMMWHADLATLTHWKGEPKDYPWSCGIVPYAVGSALQAFEKDMTVGELAATSTPAQFLALLRESPNNERIIMVDAFQEEFWQRAEALAAGWCPLPDNVIQGNFGQAKPN
jgi:hypothetical protein